MTVILTVICAQDYYALVTALPEEDEPDHFGLPANIERSRQRINSSRVIYQLKGEGTYCRSYTS